MEPRSPSPPRTLAITLWLYGPALLLLALVAVASIAMDVPVQRFTRDPLAVADLHPLVGMLSNIGVLIWCVGATICVFSAALLYHRARTDDAGFLLCVGILTLVLLVDDLFMVHERLAHMYLGVSEPVVIGLEVAALVAFLVAFRRRILASDYALLLLALLFFGLSLVVDRLPESWSRWHHIFEDGFKLLGLVGWSGYLVLTAWRSLADRTYIVASRTDTLNSSGLDRDGRPQNAEDRYRADRGALDRVR